MRTLKLYQADAFTDELFKGNPAAICILEDWLDDGLMQKIAAENNLAETAFVVPQDSKFNIRWFTPTVEVDLCGHATLASAFVIFNYIDYKEDEIAFFSHRSGHLKVTKEGDQLVLDFPADELQLVNPVQEINEGIGVVPLEVYRGKYDYLAVLSSEEEVRGVNPDFLTIQKLKSRGLIITSRGEETDFVSRFFGPQSGINEDPVTGSAHTSLIPLWSKKLDKTTLTAKQLSERTGMLYCRNEGERVKIGGEAKVYLVGEIFLE